MNEFIGIRLTLAVKASLQQENCSIGSEWIKVPSKYQVDTLEAIRRCRKMENIFALEVLC